MSNLNISNIKLFFPNIELAQFDHEYKATYIKPKPSSLITRVAQVATAAIILGAVGVLCAHFGAGAPWLSIGTITTGTCTFVGGALLAIAVVKRIHDHDCKEKEMLTREETKWNSMNTVERQDAYGILDEFNTQEKERTATEAEIRSCEYDYL